MACEFTGDICLVLNQLQRLPNVVNITFGIILCSLFVFGILTHVTYLCVMFNIGRTMETRDALYVMLSIVDLITSLTVIPFGGVQHFLATTNIYSDKLNQPVRYLGYTLNFMSVVVINTISGNLFSSLVFTYYHKKYSTTKRLVVFIIGMWLLCIFIPVYFYEYGYWREFINFINCSFWIDLLLLIIMQVFVSRELNEMMLRINYSADLKYILASRRNALKLTISIIGVSIFVYFPATMYQIYVLCYPNKVTHIHAISILDIITLINYCINPLVYYIRMESVRRNVKSIKLKKVNRVGVINTS